ncbi:hypothetical protein [Amaricoccus tamworthensis]|uniref:hypothetical protein n=1 Tax=Amaricoccus tamworthensis TaxID=57002 RepID=UPI003C7B43CB
MFKTIMLSSCVSVQGELVEDLGNGEVVVRDGPTIYRGRVMGRVEGSDQTVATAKTARRKAV